VVKGTPPVEPLAWDNPKRRLCAWIKESKAEISRIDAVRISQGLATGVALYTFAIISTIIVAPIPPLTAATLM